jgi:hypothetical protein
MDTTKDLCLKLKVSRQMIFKLRAKGLPYVKVGSGFRYDWLDVKAWLDKQK